MTAVRESLRAPIENNDNAAPREERVIYGSVDDSAPPKPENEVWGLVAVLAGVVIVSAVAVILLGWLGFYDIFFGTNHWHNG